MTQKSKNSFLLFLSLLFSLSFLFAQTSNRIEYKGRQIFLNGSNVAWVNFAKDIGPSTTNFAAFNQMFKDVRAAGGNSLRLWLHTTGAESPAFDGNGKVTGPGTNTISDLKQILDYAANEKVSLMLCLWSFDMLRISNGTTITGRANKMLTDTVYTNAYINKCLIPMITALKEHPAILSWEIFNEPEGMTNEFGWDFNLHVPISNIQRFINLTAAAIHRTDPKAKVTNGAWSMLAMTDVTQSGKISQQNSIQNLTDEQTEKYETYINNKYQLNLTYSEIQKQFGGFRKTSANKNYYSDSQLISAGGDTAGHLDFYTVHYYPANFGADLSPFHHDYASWNLDKPLVVAEFYIEDFFGLSFEKLYQILLDRGYAGGMNWTWLGDATQNARAKIVLKQMWNDNRSDIDFNAVEGDIFSVKSIPSLIEKGDTATLYWDSAKGTSLFMDGNPVPSKGKISVTPLTTTKYNFSSTGNNADTASVTVSLQPSGKIHAFTVFPPQISAGERSFLKWSTTPETKVKINDIELPEDGELEVFVNSDSVFTLTTSGEVSDNKQITIKVLPADQVNRARSRIVTVSSSEERTPHTDPNQIVDGFSATYWTSSNYGTQWVEIDLINSYVINTIKIDWGINYAAVYRVAVSEDRKNWKLVTWNRVGKGGIELYDSLKFTGQYYKMYLDKMATANGFSIKEIEIYGVPNVQVGVSEQSKVTPNNFEISQNYPNPFNPETSIMYSLQKASMVKIELYDLLGRKVFTIADGLIQAGNHTVKIDGSNLTSGIYLVHAESGSIGKTMKITLIR